MKTRHGSTFLRLGVAALLAAPIAVGMLAAGTPAGATTDLPFDTKFEIDGNPQVNSTGDWLSTAAQYPELRDNFVTTTEPCGPGEDPNRFIPGTKLDEINVNDASSFIQPGNVLTKGDICAVRRAWELVLVPEDPADPAAGGQYHFISYLAWSRVTTQGEINVLVPLLGADPNSQSRRRHRQLRLRRQHPDDHAVLLEVGRRPRPGWTTRCRPAPMKRSPPRASPTPPSPHPRART